MSIVNVLPSEVNMENSGISLVNIGNHENSRFEAEDLFNIPPSKENPRQDLVKCRSAPCCHPDRMDDWRLKTGAMPRQTRESRISISVSPQF